MKEPVARNKTTIQDEKKSTKGACVDPPPYGLSFTDMQPVQRKENKTGMPDQLKSGMESLSGIDMSDVKVHYNSSQPAQLNAHAYAQGNQIHIAPGQEKHLPHEAWHVVQQKQGRVQPTKQMKGKVNVNDDAGLEKEADVMGNRALQFVKNNSADSLFEKKPTSLNVVQRAVGYEIELGTVSVTPTQGIHPPAALHKGMVLWRGSGWDASIDELGGGAFDLEFRTSPIDDLSAGGRSKVISRLTAIQQAWVHIENLSAPFPANIYNSSAPANITINGNHAPHFAQFQASAGLSLDALQNIRSGTTINDPNFIALPHAGYVNQGGQAPALLHGAVMARRPNLRAALGLPMHENIDNMVAIIGLIVELPINSYLAAGPYAKSLAGGLMARTNFATIIRQLPPNQLHAIQTHAQAWKNELMIIVRQFIAAAGANHRINSRTNLFRAGSFPNAHLIGGRLKMKDFFLGIANGEDRATRADYRTRHLGRAEAEEFESLGSYGSNMDAGSYELDKSAALQMALGLATATIGVIRGLNVGYTLGGAVVGIHGVSRVSKALKNRPIFEFRALNLVDEPNLVNAGLALWDYVEMAEGRQAGGPNALSMGTKLWNWLGS